MLYHLPVSPNMYVRIVAYPYFLLESCQCRNVNSHPGILPSILPGQPPGILPGILATLASIGYEENVVQLWDAVALGVEDVLS
jgi:hypothetical protein